MSADHQNSSKNTHTAKAKNKDYSQSPYVLKKVEKARETLTKYPVKAK